MINCSFNVGDKCFLVRRENFYENIFKCNMKSCKVKNYLRHYVPVNNSNPNSQRRKYTISQEITVCEINTDMTYVTIDTGNSYICTIDNSEYTLVTLDYVKEILTIKRNDLTNELKRLSQIINSLDCLI